MDIQYQPLDAEQISYTNFLEKIESKNRKFFFTQMLSHIEKRINSAQLDDEELGYLVITISELEEKKWKVRLHIEEHAPDTLIEKLEKVGLA